MEWKLFDIDGTFIQDVNCQFDSLDFSVYNGASKVTVDFNKKEAHIVEKNQQFED